MHKKRLLIKIKIPSLPVLVLVPGDSVVTVVVLVLGHREGSLEEGMQASCIAMRNAINGTQLLIQTPGQHFVWVFVLCKCDFMRFCIVLALTNALFFLWPFGENKGKAASLCFLIPSVSQSSQLGTPREVWRQTLKSGITSDHLWLVRS